MNLSFTKKGYYIVALIKAVRTITTIPMSGRIDVPGYEPATYQGPYTLENGIQMHGFRLPDGTFLELESDRLTDAVLVSQQLLSNVPGKTIAQVPHDTHIDK